MTRRRLIGGGLALVLAAGLGVVMIANAETVADQVAAPRVLAVETVALASVNSYQTRRLYTGAIVARRKSELGFELAGKLARLHVDDGATVRADEPLAELDTERLKTRRRQFAARRAQASAKLEEMVAGPRDEDIASARARVASFAAQVELLRLQTARYQRLVAQSATSQDEYEQYAFGLKARQSQHDEARHDLTELLNGTRKEQILAQRAAVDEMDAAIADIDVDLGKSTLTAPFAGTIARRWADEGTVVEAGQPIFRLVEDHALEAWIGLPVHATRQLSETTMQRVKIDGRFFNATVAGRFPEVDPATRTRTVVFKLDDEAAEHVVDGQVARLELEETVQATGFWLPSTALTAGTRGLWTALVAVPQIAVPQIAVPQIAVPQTSVPQMATPPIVDDNLFRVERREIEVLHAESDRVFARGTLQVTDHVITSGTHRVVPGQLVRLTKQAPRSE